MSSRTPPPPGLLLVKLIRNQRQRSQEDSVYKDEPPQVHSRKGKRDVGGGVTNRMASGRAPFPTLWGRGYGLPHDLLDQNADTSEDEGRTSTRQRN